MTSEGADGGSYGGPRLPVSLGQRSVHVRNKNGAFHHALLSGMSFGMIDPKTWVNLSSDEAAADL